MLWWRHIVEAIILIVVVTMAIAIILMIRSASEYQALEFLRSMVDG